MARFAKLMDAPLKSPNPACAAADAKITALSSEIKQIQSALEDMESSRNNEPVSTDESLNVAFNSSASDSSHQMILDSSVNETTVETTTGF